jgi:hypothetical protein
MVGVCFFKAGLSDNVTISAELATESELAPGCSNEEAPDFSAPCTELNIERKELKIVRDES